VSAAISAYVASTFHIYVQVPVLAYFNEKQRVCYVLCYGE